ncbi:hypothetical protein C162_07809 [Paenibacillus sp. FSL R7-269]|uniref:hypothetical protein n=1 Tax=Paenibacillus sp. FSL R7-269 TaxID=1226755 RepID=UPI0003E27B07|nr:hypothetical protein [Paenibacillus sp. FSL R7-269]ETT53141.1 hypothetical protein C162_07809 [Paenibacillus sp. FSL R7-269]
MMKQYIRILMSLMVLMILIAIGKNNFGFAAESKQLRTEVVFNYDKEDITGKLIPTVKVSVFNYIDNSLLKEEYKYPELSIKNDSNGNDFAGYEEYAIIDNKAYWSVTNDLVPITAGNYARLYEFDLGSKKLKIIKQVRAIYRPLRINLYPNFKGYSISLDRSILDNKPHRENDIEIYTLPDNKLLTKVNYVRGEGIRENNRGKYVIPLPKSDHLLIGMINKSSIKPSRQHSAYWLSFKGKTGHVEREFETYKIGKDYYSEQGYELTHEGTKTEFEEPPDVSIEVERWRYIYFGSPFTYKVGNIRYSGFYDAKMGTNVVGYTTNGKDYTLYTRAGVKPDASFSPNKKYLIITQNEFNPKTGISTGKYDTLIIDTATAKVIHKLPVFENKGLSHIYEWDYGDELVGVYFFDRIKSGYLNVSTGIFVKQDFGESSSSAKRYGTNNENLLSPEISRQLILDGNELRISGQGPFISGAGLWYVPLDDFAKGVAATVSEKAGGLTISRGDITVPIQAGTVIRFKNRVYVPLDELKRSLNLKVTIK